MLANLEGKTALVTGAGHGMGKAIAKTLAMQGASVAATDRFIEIVEETVSEIKGVETLALKMDVTSQDDVDAAFDKVNSEWGQLDIVVNNAGSFSNDPEMLMAVNLYGVERCCEAAIPQMKERRSGKIVNIGSTAGHTMIGRTGPYHVSKAAVLRYTKGLASELGPFNINVNAVCPGPVFTKLPHEIDDYEEQLQNWVDFYVPFIPLERTQEPQDIANMVTFLASEDARNVTGQCVHVDGGYIRHD